MKTFSSGVRRLTPRWLQRGRGGLGAPRKHQPRAEQGLCQSLAPLCTQLTCPGLSALICKRGW